MSDAKTDIEDPRITRHKVLQALEARKKSQLVTFFLCLIFGFWGAHRFYLGDKKVGVIIAIFWSLILITMFIAGLTQKLFHALIWGFWAVIEALNEFWEFFHLFEQGNSSIRNAELFAQHNYIRYLTIIFGLFILVELFRLSRKVDVKNQVIKKEIENEFRDTTL